VSIKPHKARLGAALVAVAAVRLLAGQAPIRTLFKDLPATDARREVIQAVLARSSVLLRTLFPGREGDEGGFRSSWERARSYFPSSAYLVEPGTYLMTHGFGADGRLFIEVHDSAYLAMSVANLRTFTDAAVVGEYGRMLGQADGREAADLKDKVGRLEPYFRDEAAKARLRKALGPDLFGRLLSGLREENYHVLGGGLVHEGTHAGMDGEELVARIQAEFRAGGLAVQWDELRAFMAEAGFHGAFCRFAADAADACWTDIEAGLGDLETLRKRPRLDRTPAREKFERSTARMGAAAALARLRMRELWQSVRRLQALGNGFVKDYLKPGAPPGIGEALEKLGADLAVFVAASGEGIRGAELALRRLELVLGWWDEWAAGGRPFPPPVTDSKDVLEAARGVSWPAPPVDDIDRLKKRAEEEILRERAASSAGRRAPTTSRRPDSGPASSAG